MLNPPTWVATTIRELRVETMNRAMEGAAGKWQSRLGSVGSVSNTVISAARRRSLGFGHF